MPVTLLMLLPMLVLPMLLILLTTCGEEEREADGSRPDDTTDGSRDVLASAYDQMEEAARGDLMAELACSCEDDEVSGRKDAASPPEPAACDGGEDRLETVSVIQ